MASDKRETVYTGANAQSATRSRQYRCPCGVFTPCRTVISVDAQSDPELACRATESGMDRGINCATCSACEHREFIHLPFSYHDGSENLFVLVLPTSFRHRELEERARLLRHLAEENETIPQYVIEFSVAYGPSGLSELLSSRIRDRAAFDKASVQLRELELQGEKVLQRENEIAARETELRLSTDKLDQRSSDLTEKELSLRDRKVALDRRSSELEVKTAKLQQAQLAMRIETDGQGRDTLPEILRENSTMALGAEDILTSAASETPGSVVAKVDSATGTAVTRRPSTPLDFQAADMFAQDEPEASPSTAPAKKTSVSGEKTRVAAPNPVLLERGGAKGTPNISGPTTQNDEFTLWQHHNQASFKRIHNKSVQLWARIPSADLNELGAQDLRALLQLHRMPSYPLVSLTLATASTLSGQSGTPFSFHFDVADDKDRRILELLTDDFSFELQVFDLDYGELHRRPVAAPLGSNVRYVMSLAQESLDNSQVGSRSFTKAIQTFENPRYDRLGRRHEYARDFKDSILDSLKKPSDLRLAIDLCDTFSDGGHEEYLVATRSYPFDRWTRRRSRVIGKALKAGLWMGGSLAQIAVSEELASSRRDLVVQCQRNFSRFSAMDGCELDADGIAENWSEIDREAERLGISTPTDATVDGDKKGESSTIPKEREGEEVVLLAALNALEEEEPIFNLASLIAMCADKSENNVDQIFRVLTELPKEQLADGFASVVGIGSAGAESLRLLLDCPTLSLKQGAALALCDLHDSEGIDSVCELLVTSESILWHELAVALGHVGESAVMPIVARIAQGDNQVASRGGWALAHIAALGGVKPIETLSKSRDSNVAKVARAALELGVRIRRGDGANSNRGDAERVFSSRFYQIRQFGKTANSELSGPMMLDEGDLMEAMD